MQKDFVVYDKRDKRIIAVILNMKEEPEFLINMNYVGIYIPHDDYAISYEDNIAYFENLNKKIVWLDDYRKGNEDE